jgi:hypothetical protein
MAFPSVGSVVVRGALQNVSTLYRNESYVADEVFPLINGLNYQTKVTKYSKQPWFSNAAAFRAPGTTAKRVDWQVTTQNLDPQEVACGATVEDELFFASNQPGNLPVLPIQDTILFTSDKLDLFREVLTANSILGGTTTWADGTAGGSLPSGGAGSWLEVGASDSTTANFLKDVLTATYTIQSKTGIKPNTLLMDFNTYTQLLLNEPTLQRLKYTMGPAVVTTDLLAQMLGLKQVIVGETIKATSNENENSINTPTMSPVWDSQLNPGKGMAFLYYRPAAAGLKQPSVGYQYRVAYDGNTWRRLISYREEWNHQSVYEASEWIEIVPVLTDVGYLWTRTIA